MSAAVQQYGTPGSFAGRKSMQPPGGHSSLSIDDGSNFSPFAASRGGYEEAGGGYGGQSSILSPSGYEASAYGAQGGYGASDLSSQLNLPGGAAGRRPPSAGRRVMSQPSYDSYGGGYGQQHSGDTCAGSAYGQGGGSAHAGYGGASAYGAAAGGGYGARSSPSARSPGGGAVYGSSAYGSSSYGAGTAGYGASAHGGAGAGGYGASAYGGASGSYNVYGGGAGSGLSGQHGSYVQSAACGAAAGGVYGARSSPSTCSPGGGGVYSSSAYGNSSYGTGAAGYRTSAYGGAGAGGYSASAYGGASSSYDVYGGGAGSGLSGQHGGYVPSAANTPVFVPGKKGQFCGKIIQQPPGGKTSINIFG